MLALLHDALAKNPKLDTGGTAAAAANNETHLQAFLPVGQIQSKLKVAISLVSVA